LIGARSEDVEEPTEFDEGLLPADWIGELEPRHRRDARRNAMPRAPCCAYGESGGERY
jgi:hypothetical protein